MVGNEGGLLSFLQVGHKAMQEGHYPGIKLVYVLEDSSDLNFCRPQSPTIARDSTPLHLIVIQSPV